VDLNQLLHRHQLSLMQRDRAESPEERSAHSQFASDFAAEIETAREMLGAPAQVRLPREPDPFGIQPAQDVCVTTRVVLTPLEDLPYAVVVSHDLEERSRRSFSTMREAEIHIRRIMPTAAPHSTLYDRKSGQV
jgi:hypothetical protein